ncbi:MAG: pyruvate formate lyase family protein, partial [Armatimonadota bacterium]|nr:pyruvate formate lyase family protein [Armatimonadota bacterium]
HYLEVLNRALLSIEEPDRISHVEEILTQYRQALRQHLRSAFQQHRRHRLSLAERAPMPLTTALMDGGVARGRDFHVAMEYNLPGLYERGLANAANALASLQHVVFEERWLRLDEVLAAMRADFPDETLRRRLSNAPRWGNDDDRADRWALRLQEIREEVKREVEAELGEPYHLSCHVVRSLHHVDGRRIGASPDGRRAGKPVSDSIGACPGTPKAGPTALLNSVRKLQPARYWAGGTNLNLNLPPMAVQSYDQLRSVVAMVDAFFADGGQELQLACLDGAALRRAQRHPEEFPDLVVRVAGFNARFVSLSPAQQEEVIARAEAAQA